jgi:hypothetical protein
MRVALTRGPAAGQLRQPGREQVYCRELGSMLSLFLGPGHQVLNPICGAEKLDALG